MSYPWSGCSKGDDFCWAKGRHIGMHHRYYALPNKTIINFHKNHRFDEVVRTEDAKEIDPYNIAVINHIQFHRNWYAASQQALQQVGDYTSRFFPKVMRELSRRNLVLPVTLQEKGWKPYPEPDFDWTAYEKIVSEALRTKSWYSQMIRHEVVESDLPAWAADYSDMFMGSIIERESETLNLYLTTFLLSHSIMEIDDDRRYARKIQNGSIPLWKQFIRASESISYTQSGRRLAHGYSCRIRNSARSEPYEVQGFFLPNRVSNDQNANRRLDILRCEMQDTVQAHLKLARTDEVVSVEIMRHGAVMVKFAVSWRSRSGGKTIWTSENSTRVDMWEGFNASAPLNRTYNKMHLCVPGLDSVPTIKTLPIYLEFVQHHLLLNIDHIFLSAPLVWSSPHMTKLLQAFQHFIQDGSVTMSSLAIDDADFLYSVRGMSVHRDNLKIYQVNMCTYLSKGMAEYVGLWDIDEFLIPKDKHSTIDSLIEAVESTPRPAGNHPFCYLELKSEVVANREATSEVDLQHVWTGERFQHATEPRGSRVANQFSFQKSIIPTDKIFQVGLHISGACMLPPPYNCAKQRPGDWKENQVNELSFEKKLDCQYFDEVVDASDVLTINDRRQAVIYHFMIFRFYHSVQDTTVLKSKNDYALYYYERTLAALKAKNLDIFFDLPKDIQDIELADTNWTPYELVYESRTIQGSLFLGDKSKKIKV